MCLCCSPGCPAFIMAAIISASPGAPPSAFLSCATTGADRASRHRIAIPLTFMSNPPFGLERLTLELRPVTAYNNPRRILRQEHGKRERRRVLAALIPTADPVSSPEPMATPVYDSSAIEVLT